jgi:rubrerythrin
MVLPATEMALRQQDRRLRRIHRKHIEVDDEVLKSVARQEAEQAALFALHKLFDPESTDVKRPLSSTIASAAKSASEKRGTVGRYEPLASTDIAVHRGSLRALGETNESGFLGSLAQSGDFDLTTVTEEVTNGTVEARKSQEAKKKKNGFKSLAKKFTWGNNRKGVKIEQLPKLFSGISKEAWMCGCCGKVFSTYEAADYHETRCIQAALGAVGNGTNNEDALAIPQDSQSLSSIAIASIGVERRFAGGKVDDDLMRDIGLGDDHVMVDNSRISRFGQSSSIYASARNEGENVGDLDWGLESPISQRDKVSLLQNQGYLREVDVSFSDHVRGVGPQLDHSSGRRRMSNGPRRDPNEPEDILLTSSMRHGITETDEALKNAVERATGLLLSQQHIDAERDLKFIASGMAYYQEMSERASLLKAHPRIKYKTDGKTAREKIQNKFVDAWQLIKEGDGENDPLRDQYEKKSRRDNEGSGELVHDQNTHYINVFVKHSARVVTSELERIARQRWIDQVEGSAESKDNFEQFRKFAHFNLVKFAKLALSVDFTPRKVAVQLSNDLYR